jgi:hypothetical protein
MRIRRLFAVTLAALVLGAVAGVPVMAALPGPGLPPVGDKCAMQDYLGIQNGRACEDDY